MEQRVNMISLAVESVPKSRAFYQALGWVVGQHSETDDVCFFQVGTCAVCLYPRAMFSKDLVDDEAKADAPATATEKSEGGSEDAAAPPAKRARVDGPVTEAPLVILCYLARTKEEVGEVADKFAAAGGRIVMGPKTTTWGGYSAYVADVDGVMWEITLAMGPFQLNDKGFADLTLPANGTDKKEEKEEEKN